MTTVNEVVLAKQLLPIWNQTIQRANGEVAQDFFEAAGGIGTALKLLTQIKNAGFGQFPPILLYRAPTLDHLVELIAGPRPIPFSGAIRLKVGAPDKTVFFAHGLDGTVTEFASLTEHIGTSHQIFGIQARGSDGCAPPDQTLELMAEFHFQEICKTQPLGTYYLVGHSLGGLVMLETARRLIASKRSVGLLTMIDSFPHLKRIPLSDRLKVYRQRLLNLSRHLAQSKSELPINSETIRVNSIAPDATGVAVRSWEKYSPSSYEGNVRFIRAAVSIEFPENPGSIWGKWIKHLTLESVPGNHRTILTEHVRALGDALTRHLNESTAEA
jgi:thioesterase domain-containing protein